MKIALLNVYGKKNIGDEAINQMAVQLVRDAFHNKAKIFSIAVDVHEAKDEKTKDIEKIVSPYGYAINEGGEKISGIDKLCRFIEIMTRSCIVLWITAIYPGFTPKSKKLSFIEGIRESDLVLNMGGGYLRTKEKYKDYFGLILTLLPIYVAKFYKKPMIFLPMSFDDFASRVQERLAFSLLSGSTFFARDEITLQKVNVLKDRYNSVFESLYSPDLALLNPYESTVTVAQKKRSSYVVLSAREWMSKDGQEKYERSLADVVDYLNKKYELKTVFVAMASNSIEDNDLHVAKRIQKQVKDKRSFSISSVNSPDAVLALLDKARMAICTRMHSAILSSLVYTPFITIQYEHKTLGFMKTLGLEGYNFSIEKVDFSLLRKRIDLLLASGDAYGTVYQKLKSRKQENKKYKQIVKQRMISV